MRVVALSKIRDRQRGMRQNLEGLDVNGIPIADPDDLGDIEYASNGGQSTSPPPTYGY